jgi:type I restriction-modification system DNA methylase subunit
MPEKISAGGNRKGIMNQYGKDFIKILDNLRPSKHAYEVFNDWLIMAAASLYAPWKKDQAVEEEYMQIAKQYTGEELDKHGQLLAITVNALEETGQDFLGEVFTMAELANSRTGQFFTPYHISYMMAEMIIGENEFPKNRVCRINDPTCGAGGMLIAGAMVMKKRDFNYQQDALFIGQDIDARCARMAYIQLSLLGIPALIICGNTLTFETYWQRETIGYHMAGMEFRLMAEDMLDKTRGLEQAAPGPIQEEEPLMEIRLPRRELVQGELF